MRNPETLTKFDDWRREDMLERAEWLMAEFGIIETNAELIALRQIEEEEARR